MAVKPYGQYARFWLGPDLNIAVKNPVDIRVRKSKHYFSASGQHIEE